MLAGNTVKLSVFFDAVGREVYGAEWPEDAASLIDLRVLPEKDSRRASAHQIHDDLINAFYSESIEVVSFIKIERKIRISRARSQYLSPSDQEAFIVQPSFWEAYQRGDRQVEWSGSLTDARWTDLVWSDIKLNSRYYVTPEHFLEEGIDPFVSARCELLVHKPLEAFQSLFKIIEVPEQEWFKRYRKFRNIYTLEVVAAGWRYLAVEKPEKDRRGLREELVKALQSYLDEQLPGREVDEALSDPALKNIASKILLQWRADPPTTGSVLVNTNLLRADK